MGHGPRRPDQSQGARLFVVRPAAPVPARRAALHDHRVHPVGGELPDFLQARRRADGQDAAPAQLGQVCRTQPPEGKRQGSGSAGQRRRELFGEIGFGRLRQRRGRQAQFGVKGDEFGSGGLHLRQRDLRHRLRREQVDGPGP